MNSIENKDVQYDVAIVGSGPGGSVTAYYLAQSGFKVVVLEEGEIRDADSFSLDEVRDKYRNAGLTVALGKPTISYLEGRCLGGGADVNSGLYQRCPEEILQQWEHEYQAENLVNSINEQYEALDKEFFSGPAGALNGAAEKLRRGAENLGWKWFNVPRLDRTKTMRKTYLAKFEALGGNVSTGLRVDKLVYKKNSGWLLKSTSRQRGVFEIKARFVFVCGGAIQSAALLLRSGIHKNIGKSLAMHPTAKVVAEFSDPISESDSGPGTIQVKEFAPELSMGCSVSAPPFLAATMSLYPESMKEILYKYKNMAVYYAMIRGPQQGRVRVFPGMKDPIVSYQLPAGHFVSLYEGVQKLTHLLRATGVNKVYLPYRGQDPRRMRMANYHLFGTVPCGENRALCAADSYGAVYNQKGLFVSDASLFCSAPGVNPQATIMAMARRNALRFIATQSARF